MNNEYNIEDFDIKIIKFKDCINEYTTSPEINAIIIVNGYEIKCNYRYNLTDKQNFITQFNLDYYDYIKKQLEYEAFKFYTSDKLLMRKEKIKKIKNLINEENRFRFRQYFE